MARDGSRAYEYNATKVAALQKRIRLAKASEGPRDTNKPMLPTPPTPPSGVVKENAVIMAKEFSPTLDEYAETLLRLNDVEEVSAASELPRILCRKSGVEIGRVAPAQYAVMRAIWPALTLETAEQIIQNCGMIAPQFLFTMPAAWSVMVAANPAATLTLALEIGLRAHWEAPEKAARNAAWIETAGDDEELILIAFELISDLMRINRDWQLIKSIQKFIPQIANSLDIGELIEMLKDTAHLVARETHAYMRDPRAIKLARIEELFDRHGVKLMQRRKPIIGEADLARRVIGAYFNDYKYLTARLSNAELMAIIGDAIAFERKAYRAFQLGFAPRHAGLEKYKREVARAEAEMNLDALMSGLLDDDMSEPVASSVKNNEAEQQAALGKMRQWAQARKMK